MKLEIGKKYKDRNGRIWRIVSPGKVKSYINCLPGQFVGVLDGTENSRYPSWNKYLPDGFVCDGKFGKDSEYDLIEEVCSLNLEIGKFYRTVNGYKVKVLENNVPKRPNSVIVMDTVSGNAWVADKNGVYKYNDRFNIVGEWTDTVNVEGWVSVFVNPNTGMPYTGEKIYTLREDALGNGAVTAVKVKFKYEVK